MAQLNIISARQIEREISIARSLQEAMSREFIQGRLDPITVGIAQDADRLAWLQVCLLGCTTLRWKELNRLDLVKYIHGQAQHIKQYKTGTNRLIQPLPAINEVEFPSWDNSRDFMRLGYDSVKSAINRATPRHVRQLLADCNDSTHIFRHLRASWLSAQGWTDQKIANYFVHQSAETTQSYIHGDLVSIFNSNQK